jgi:hypothetical protein
MQATKEVNPHPRIAPYVNIWIVTFFFFFFFFFFRKIETLKDITNPSCISIRNNHDFSSNHTPLIPHQPCNVLGLFVVLQNTIHI